LPLPSMNALKGVSGHRTDLDTAFMDQARSLLNDTLANLQQKMEAENDAKTSKISEMTSDLDKALSDVRTLEEKNIALEKRSKKLSKWFDSATTDLKASGKRNLRLEQENKQLKTSLDEMETQMNQEVKKLEREKERLEKELSSVKSDMEEIGTKNEELEQENEELAEKVVTTEVELRETSLAAEKERTMLNKEVATAKAGLETMAMQIIALEEDNNDWKNKLAATTKDLKENHIQPLENAKEALTQELEAAKADIKAMAKRYVNVEATNLELREKMDSAQREWKDAEGKTKKENKDLQSRCDEMKAVMEDLAYVFDVHRPSIERSIGSFSRSFHSNNLDRDDGNTDAETDSSVPSISSARLMAAKPRLAWRNKKEAIRVSSVRSKDSVSSLNSANKTIKEHESASDFSSMESDNETVTTDVTKAKQELKKSFNEIFESFCENQGKQLYYCSCQTGWASIPDGSYAPKLCADGYWGCDIVDFRSENHNTPIICLGGSELETKLGVDSKVFVLGIQQFVQNKGMQLRFFKAGVIDKLSVPVRDYLHKCLLLGYEDPISKNLEKHLPDQSIYRKEVGECATFDLS